MRKKIIPKSLLSLLMSRQLWNMEGKVSKVCAEEHSEPARASVCGCVWMCVGVCGCVWVCVFLFPLGYSYLFVQLDLACVPDLT